MICIYCGHKTEIINSRLQKRSNQVWRRRKCLACHAVFTTTEANDLSKSLMVQTAKRLQPFSRDKLLLSVYDSVRHRKTAVSDASELVTTIVKSLPRTTDGSINIESIKQITLAVLQRFDTAASVHYQAFHPLSTA